MKIKLYTTHCPKCKILEDKLANSNIEYEIVDLTVKENMDTFAKEHPGVDSVPQMDVDGAMMPFRAANHFLNNIRKLADSQG